MGFDISGPLSLMYEGFWFFCGWAIAGFVGRSIKQALTILFAAAQTKERE